MNVVAALDSKIVLASGSVVVGPKKTLTLTFDGLPHIFKFVTNTPIFDVSVVSSTQSSEITVQTGGNMIFSFDLNGGRSFSSGPYMLHMAVNVIGGPAPHISVQYTAVAV